MVQRFLTSLVIGMLMIGVVTSGLAADTSTDTPPGNNLQRLKKTPENAFLDGLTCLQKKDIVCAHLNLVNIPSSSVYNTLLSGNIAATSGDFDQVFLLLLPLQAQTDWLPQAHASLHASLALAYENQPDASRALEQLTEAETSMTEPADIAANQQHIWHLIGGLPKTQLVEMRGASLDTTIQGWIDLALAVQSTPTLAAIQNWHNQYPDHPATEAFINQLSSQYAEVTPPGSSAPIQSTANSDAAVVTSLQSQQLSGPIALLLPFEVTEFYPAADAIDRGFAAAQAQAGNNALLKLYPTHGNKDEIVGLYQQAIRDGARYIVGPLTRDELHALLTDTTLSSQTPTAAADSPITLALNQPDTPNSLPNLYSFGLSVDAEVAQIVQIARDEGMQSAIVVASDNPLASRMAGTFSDTWTQQGGRINLQVGAIKNADLDDIKLQIASHPADMIFLAANSDDARNLRPYLDPATPTFGVSHIYAGVTQDSQDKPLAAVRFVDMPWILAPNDSTFAAYKTAAADLPLGEMQRWFALGVDAYHVLAALTVQANAAQTNRPLQPVILQGLTGKISISASGEITRELAIGRFSNDGVVLEKMP